MKKQLLSSLFLASALSSQAAIVLYDDFAGGGIGTGDGTSVNGGFQLVTNGVNPSGTVGETPSNATISTGGSFDNTGVVSINSFNVAADTSISATWVIDSHTDDAVGTELLLQGGTGFRQSNSIRFNINGSGELLLVGNEGAGNVILSSTINVGGLSDGFSLTMNLDAAGWAISSTGLTGDPTNVSGSWTGGFDYTDLQGNLHAAATIQRDPSLSAMNVDSISVDVSSVPEPSSAALLGLGGMALILRRRK